MRLSRRDHIPMLDRPNILALPRQKPSPAALAASGALHVALAWLLLQYTPVQQAVRYVVTQVVRPQSANPPATSPAAASSPPPSRAITLPGPRGSSAESPDLFSNTPQSSVPMQVTDQLPDTLKPARKKRRRAQPAPEPAREEAPAASPSPALKSETQLRLPEPVQEVAPAPPPEPAPPPLPVPEPVPVPAPAPVPV